MRPRRAHPGLTLIETLAVVTILGLVAATVLVQTGGASDAARRRAAIAACRDLDAVARGLAGPGDPVLLRVRSEGRTVAVARASAWAGTGPIGVPDDPRTVAVDLPPGLTAWTEIDRGTAGGAAIVRPGGGAGDRWPGADIRDGDVVYGAAGRTDDFTLHVAAEDGRRWTIGVRGLTGWTTLTRPGPAGGAGGRR